MKVPKVEKLGQYNICRTRACHNNNMGNPPYILQFRVTHVILRLVVFPRCCIYTALVSLTVIPTVCFSTLYFEGLCGYRK